MEFPTNFDFLKFNELSEVFSIHEWKLFKQTKSKELNIAYIDSKPNRKSYFVTLA